MSERRSLPDAAPSRGGGVQRELEESEARYRALFEQSPLGVLTFDRRLRIEDCNLAFVRLLESSYERLLGLDMRTLKDASLIPALERVLEGEPMFHEGHSVAATSEARIDIAMWLTPMRDADGDVVGGLAIVENVTTRRAAQEALARSEANFRAVIENAPDAIGVFRAGQHLYVNPKLAEYLGYGRDAHHARPVLDMIHPDDRAQFSGRAERRERGEVLGAAEFRLVHRDGRVMTAEITSMKITFDGGPAVLCMIRDVSDRKVMQARLVQSDRLASVGLLAAGIAHEINNPLAYVMTSLEILARNRLPELERAATTDEQRAVISRIVETIGHAHEGAERMRRIVRDVKTFARGDDDAREPVDVRAVVEAALQLVAHEIRQKARLVCDFAQAPPVLASESRLGQVFLNLLVNAVQALGGAGHDEIRVRIACTDGAWVEVEVGDTGQGIAPEALPRVFDPFFTTKPVGEGTGLGLFVCHGIVTSLGGSLDVTSTVGRGTTVRVRLPAATATAMASVRSAPVVGPKARTRRGRLLLVDDEASLGRALAAALSDEHEVVNVTSGEDAVAELAKDDRFDVVLCDLMMPGTSGIDVWRRARDAHPRVATRFVFVTGGAFTAEASAFLDEGHPYLEKPFDLAELRSLVRERLTGGKP